MELRRPALIPYFTAGWPTEEAFLGAVRAAARAGCSAFEVGIPFSDPIADGPVIQRTSQQALEAGMTPDRALQLTALAVGETGLPAVAMTYTNLLWKRGLDRFMADLASHGVQGLILPDLPLEEGDEVEEAAARHGVDLVYLVAPTTPPPRRRLLARRTRGFLYVVSVTGVTGERADLPETLDRLVEDLRGACPVPVCVGFGISTPEQAARVAARADGVIVGSALLRRMEEAGPDLESVVESYLSSLRAAMAGATAG